MSKKIATTISSAAVSFLVLYLVFGRLADAGKAESYEIAGDSVPSVATAIGYRKVRRQRSTDGEEPGRELTFTTDTPARDVRAYAGYLTANAGFRLLADIDPNLHTGFASLVGPSSEAGMALHVEITYNIGSFTVTLARKKALSRPQSAAGATDYE